MFKVFKEVGSGKYVRTSIEDKDATDGEIADLSMQINGKIFKFKTK